jgi:hypothetical protein
MHVRVDEAGHDEAAGGIELLCALVGAEAGDVAVDHGDVGLEPLAREDGEDPAAAHDEVGRLVPRATASRRARSASAHVTARVGLARGRPDPASLDEALR